MNTGKNENSIDSHPPHSVRVNRLPALFGKLHRTNREKILFLCLLFIFAAGNVIPWCENHAPADLISMYTSGYMVRNGENPYNDLPLKATWNRIVRKQNCTPEERRQPPGLPNAVLYPPNTLLLYSFLSVIPFRYLTATLRIVLLLLMFAVIRMVWTQNKPGTFSDFLLIALTFAGLNGTPWLIVSINTSIFIYFFLFAFYRSFRNNHDIIAGIFLGAMSLKITLMIPVFIFVCIRRKWRIALISGITAAIPCIIMFLSNATFCMELFSSWMQATREWDRLLHVIYTGGELWHGHDVWEWNKMLDYITTIGPMISFYLRPLIGSLSYPAAKLVTLFTAALMSTVILLTARRRRIPDEHLIILLSCIELTANYHHQYDTIIPLLFLLMIWQSIPRRTLFIIVGAVSLYFIPFNGVFLRLGVPKHLYLWAFNMAVPLFVIFISTLMICPPKRELL
ncbi:MAG: DUF2029 domain-containing protein [Chitinispirillaceae bacterium]|nr:DUF2029 domain-containing protein [Chitinispirillaceae bacterium]